MTEKGQSYRETMEVHVERNDDRERTELERRMEVERNDDRERTELERKDDRKGRS